MPVPKELTGTYRQVAWKLRIAKDSGPDKVSERPRKGKRGPYQDNDEPTLVEIAADDNINVEAMLAQGAIEPYTPPKPTKPTKPTKGASNGKARSE